MYLRNARLSCHQVVLSNVARQMRTWMSQMFKKRAHTMMFALTTVSLCFIQITRSNEHSLICSDSISLDSTYSPAVLDDFDPNVMKISHCNLMQLPLYDLKERLIAPWEMYEKFRPGTLLMIKAVLNIHHFPANGFNVRV